MCQVNTQNILKFKSDLIKVLKWNMGAIIAQCSHGVAVVSVCLTFIDH